MTQRETLVAWLNDAYGTEENLAKVLEHQIKDAANQPMIQSRLESHLDETRHHADLVQQCIERLGGSVSTTKSVMGKMSGMFQGMGTGGSDDEMIKNLLADASMEHFEIACYKALIAGAEAAGEADVADTCRQILRDEERMAQWIEEQLPTAVPRYLQQQAVS